MHERHEETQKDVNDIKNWTKLDTYEKIKEIEDRMKWTADVTACQTSVILYDTWWWWWWWWWKCVCVCVCNLPSAGLQLISAAHTHAHTQRCSSRHRVTATRDIPPWIWLSRNPATTPFGSATAAEQFPAPVCVRAAGAVCVRRRRPREALRDKSLPRRLNMETRRSPRPQAHPLWQTGTVFMSHC